MTFPPSPGRILSGAARRPYRTIADAGAPGARRRGLARRVALAAVVVVAACSTLPRNDERDETHAIVDDGATRLQRIAAASAPAGPAAEPGDETMRPSGFRIVGDGEEAFGVLATLIANAQVSLDLQYYIIEDDAYSRALLRGAREAASRGVRVRLLVDDLYTTGKDDRIAWYASHPNIEVRVFNPFGMGRPWMLTRMAASVADVGRINHRMHNKLFVADNAFAVTGGRNIGAEYYMQSERTNFLDVDLVVAGPVVKDLSEAFDRYWNSRYAYAIDTLTNARRAPLETSDSRAAADPADPSHAAAALAVEKGAPLQRALDAGRVPMVVEPARIFVDRPAKVGRSAPREGPAGLRSGKTIATDIAEFAQQAKEELIVVSPYFVPGERGTKILTDLMARGVKLRIVTNSLAATDAAVVHIGYARYRKQLIEAGAEIYEVRPEPGAEREHLSAVGSSKASLHAKVILVDRHTLFVGSFNVDRRSVLANTEMGIEIESRALADEVLALLRKRGDEGRYRVTVGSDGGLVWTTSDGGVDRVYRDEPEAGTLLKLALRLLAPFAPEAML